MFRVKAENKNGWGPYSLNSTMFSYPSKFCSYQISGKMADPLKAAKSKFKKIEITDLVLKKILYMYIDQSRVIIFYRFIIIRSLMFDSKCL